MHQKVSAILVGSLLLAGEVLGGPVQLIDRKRFVILQESTNARQGIGVALLFGYARLKLEREPGEAHCLQMLGQTFSQPGRKFSLETRGRAIGNFANDDLDDRIDEFGAIDLISHCQLVTPAVCVMDGSDKDGL